MKCLLLLADQLLADVAITFSCHLQLIGTFMNGYERSHL